VYYELCLRSKHKALILHDRPAKEYQALLRDDVTDDLGALEFDAGGLLAIEGEGDSGDDDVDCGVISVGGGAGLQQSLQQVPNASDALARVIPALGSDTPPASPAVAEPPSGIAVQNYGGEVIVDFSDSESNEERQIHQPSSSSGGPVSVEPPPVFCPPALGSYPEFLCGVRIRLETTNPTNAAPYKPFGGYMSLVSQHTQEQTHLSEEPNSRRQVHHAFRKH
jgi:hypothetical protein